MKKVSRGKKNQPKKRKGRRGNANVRASGSTSSKRSSSPEAFDATSSFINPLFEEGGSGRGSSVNLHTSSLEMTELVDEYVDDKAAKASSLDIREVSGTA